MVKKPNPRKPKTTKTSAFKNAKDFRNFVNKAFVERKAKFPTYGERVIVRNSKMVPTWGAPKPPTLTKSGKRITSVVGNTRNVYRPPVIKNYARTTQDQPIRRPAPKGTTDLARQRALPTEQVARRTQVRSNMRALRRAQNAVPMAKVAKAARVLKPLARINPAVGAGLLMYDAMKGIDKLAKRATGPGGRGYHGQFVDYTSKPTNRGKRGVNY